MFLKIQNDFKLVSGNADNVIKALTAGVYKAELKKEGFSNVIYFSPAEERPEHTMLTTGVFADINANLNAFFEPAMCKARKAIGSLNKFSCLIYGEQGSGKTHHVMLWAQKIARERNAISIIISNTGNFNLSELIDSVRDNDPNRLIVLILEEFEKSSIRYEDPRLLSFLDGSDSKDNMIILATCNNISDMPSIILDRPGRFEKKFCLKAGNRDVMRGMLKSIVPAEYATRINTERLLDILESKQKWTIDYIRVLLRNAIAELIFADEHGYPQVFPDIFDDGSEKLAAIVASLPKDDNRVKECCGNCAICDHGDACSEESDVVDAEIEDCIEIFSDIS